MASGDVKSLFHGIIRKMGFFGENIDKIYDVYDDFNKKLGDMFDISYDRTFIDTCPDEDLNDRFKWVTIRGKLGEADFRNILKGFIRIVLEGFTVNNLKDLLKYFTDGDNIGNVEIYENSISGNYIGEDKAIGGWVLGESQLGINSYLGISTDYCNFAEIVIKNFKNNDYRDDLERILLELKPMWIRILLVYGNDVYDFLEKYSYINGNGVERYDRVGFDSSAEMEGDYGVLLDIGNINDGDAGTVGRYSVVAGHGNDNHYKEKFNLVGPAENPIQANYIRFYEIKDANGDLVTKTDDNNWILNVDFCEEDENKGSFNINLSGIDVHDVDGYLRDIIINGDRNDADDPFNFGSDVSLSIIYYRKDGLIIYDSYVIPAGNYTADDLVILLNSNLSYTIASKLNKVEAGISKNYISLKNGGNLNYLRRMFVNGDELGFYNKEGFSLLMRDVNQIRITFSNWFEGDNTINEILFFIKSIIKYDELVERVVQEV